MPQTRQARLLELVPSVLAHLAAFALCFALAVGAPLLLLTVLYFFAPESLEPAEDLRLLALVYTGAVALGCAALAALVALLRLARRKWPYPNWLPPLVLPPLALGLAALLVRSDEYPLLAPLVAGLSASLAFLLYWTVLLAVAALLRWFLRLLAKITAPISPE